MQWVFQHHSDVMSLYHTLHSSDIRPTNAFLNLENYYSDSDDDDEDDDDDDDDDDEEEEEEEEEDDDDNDEKEEVGVEYEWYHGCSPLKASDITNHDGDEEEDDDGDDDNEEVGEEHEEYYDDEEVGEGYEEEEEEWNSDDDYTFETKRITNDTDFYGNFYFLGFHPYKEVIFLAWDYKVVAYNLGRCKAHYLGYCVPTGFGTSRGEGVLESFPYTPCFIDALPN